MLNGIIDDLKIFDRGLEHNEIIEEMNNHAEFYVITGKFELLKNLTVNLHYSNIPYYKLLNYFELRIFSSISRLHYFQIKSNSISLIRFGISNLGTLHESVFQIKIP